MNVDYRVNHKVSSDQFISLLVSSGLADRRPVQDVGCIEGMLSNSNLIVSAWFADELVGIARCVTDFHYTCYMSDLAVAREYQKMGIGSQLQTQIKNQLGPRCKLVLLAAPDANQYYERLGYSNNPRCWVLEADEYINE